MKAIVCVHGDMTTWTIQAVASFAEENLEMHQRPLLVGPAVGEVQARSALCHQ